MSSLAKRFRVATGISRSDEQKRNQTRKKRAAQAKTRKAKRRQTSRQRARDRKTAAAQAKNQQRAKQLGIVARRDERRQAALDLQGEIVSSREEEAQNVRRRFSRSSGGASTILTSARGLTSGRAPVRRRKLFAILGEGGR